MKRPGHGTGVATTTPDASVMLGFLGRGHTVGGVAFTNSEWCAVKRLYGYVDEKPRDRPLAPVAPNRADFSDGYPGGADYAEACRRHKMAQENHAKWTDPKPFFQAGADINAGRHAEHDGLRLIAWLARYVEPGADPLKTLVYMAIEAGVDVDPADVEWARSDEDLAPE